MTALTGSSRINIFKINNSNPNNGLVWSRVPNNSASRIVDLQIRRNCVEQ